MTDPVDELRAAQEQLAALQAQIEALQAKAAAGSARDLPAESGGLDTPAAPALDPRDVPAESGGRGAPEAASGGRVAPEARIETSNPKAETPAPLGPDHVERIRAGYDFTAPSLALGALVNGDARPDVQVRIPLGMLGRHGLVAGATGTGKTRTLQLIAEQLSAAGVPVFAADIKGDLSGIATPGDSSEKLLARTASIGQDWSAASFPTEFYTLGGRGTGVPIRASVSSFGPLLLSRVLELNDTQESSLGLVFHYADSAGLPLLDLADLRAVLNYLVSDDGKPELAELGGLSKATVGVILRKLIAFADQGADVFFGEPEIDTQLLMRLAPDGRGIVSLLEIPEVYDKPAVFSTFLMWLLADLFESLPEVGDVERPKLVFFFDEAHLLFRGASKDFLASIVATVRLIRSKGVGIVFVTQSPKDIPNDVLAQLGSRVQHQLRAHTPDDAKALRAAVGTYPKSGYDLEEVLTTLATGEAIVTVMNEKGAPSPVAWTRLRAPQASMSPTDPSALAAQVAASPLSAQYGTAIDRESAREMLAARMNAAVERDAREQAQQAQRGSHQASQRAAKDQYDEEYRKAKAQYERSSMRTTSTRRSTSTTEKVIGSAVQTAVNGVLRGVLKNLFR
ncbi:MAG TPA: helicase HerA-like domain-containing protein [Microbacteriaceae bacterium]|nr:helicase HerA-like domain-containing protein [Microbacteriaceae bacterium]